MPVARLIAPSFVSVAFSPLKSVVALIASVPLLIRLPFSYRSDA
jgi:hypothetical protein